MFGNNYHGPSFAKCHHIYISMVACPLSFFWSSFTSLQYWLWHENNTFQVTTRTESCVDSEEHVTLMICPIISQTLSPEIYSEGCTSKYPITSLIYCPGIYSEGCINEFPITSQNRSLGKYPEYREVSIQSGNHISDRLP